jgi:hypothetical protein
VHLPQNFPYSIFSPMNPPTPKTLQQSGQDIIYGWLFIIFIFLICLIKFSKPQWKIIFYRSLVFKYQRFLLTIQLIMGHLRQYNLRLSILSWMMTSYIHLYSRFFFTISSLFLMESFKVLQPLISQAVRLLLAQFIIIATNLLHSMVALLPWILLKLQSLLPLVCKCDQLICSLFHLTFCGTCHFLELVFNLALNSIAILGTDLLSLLLDIFNWKLVLRFQIPYTTILDLVDTITLVTKRMESWPISSTHNRPLVKEWQSSSPWHNLPNYLLFCSFNFLNPLSSLPQIFQAITL